MFDYLKAEISLLKESDKIYANVFTYDSLEYAGLTDGYICVCIPISQCHLNILKLRQTNIQNLIDGIEFSSYKPVTLNDLCKRKDKNITLRFDGANEPIYVNEKYFKRFPECKFFGKDGESALIAKDYSGILVGLISPMRGVKW